MVIWVCIRMYMDAHICVCIYIYTFFSSSMCSIVHFMSSTHWFKKKPEKFTDMADKLSRSNIHLKGVPQREN